MTTPNDTDSPLIVAFIGELMAATRVENTVRQLGYRIETIGRAEDIAPLDLDAPTYRPGEPLYGQGGALFQKLTEWQPALLIFDLENKDVPWRKWIATLKSSAATRRLPILCYGPHVEEDALKEARRRGADQVVPRGRFVREMPDLIQKLARQSDKAALNSACDEPLAELARKGIDAFNRGDFYDAHEDLEAAWMADTGPGRDLYRAILQIAVAYYQIERGNFRGAVKMLMRVRQWLEPLPAVCRGVNVDRLREDVRQVHDALLALGPDRVGQLDRALFRPVELSDDA